MVSIGTVSLEEGDIGFCNKEEFVWEFVGVEELLVVMFSLTLEGGRISMVSGLSGSSDSDGDSKRGAR